MGWDEQGLRLELKKTKASSCGNIMPYRAAGFARHVPHVLTCVAEATASTSSAALCPPFTSREVLTGA